MPPADRTEAPLLEMRSITKRFPGVLALSEVSFDVRAGEVHALVGENGAGKSTLMKILSGVYERDGGEILFKGKPYDPKSPRQAQVAGITTIYQELNQVPYLSVTENIFLGSELMRGPFVDWPAMHRQASQLLAKLHLDVDPRTQLDRLGVAQQQMVEVAKALHHKADLIIMDEPTSALSVREIEDLFAIIRELQAAGVAMVYISHHLDEAFAVSNRITVLRDGRHTGTYPTSELNVDEADPPDGGPRPVRAVPQGGRPRVGRRCCVSKGSTRAASWSTSTSAPTPAKCWASPGWSAQGARNSCAHLWRRPRSTRAASMSTASRCTSAARATPSAQGSPCSPRTASSRGWCSR